MFQNWFIFLEYEDTYACPCCSGHTPCWGGWGILLLTRGTRGPRGLKGGARTQGATARARAKGNGRTRTSGTGSQTRAEVKG